MPSEACIEELETLTAIFLDEVNINDALPDGGTLVSMILFPATGDDEESRYVTLTLEISLCSNYPRVPPKILFRNPRGLNDVMLDELMKQMKERCEERLDSQMIYELIDMGKEFLTKNNRPASECPICLLSFTEFDVFFRTECFHHFHSNCLGHYLQNIINAPENENFISSRGSEKKELNCPVCRKELESDIDVQSLVSAPPPSEEFESISKDTLAVLQDWEDKRQSMQEIFEKQKSQGGIIDLTEKNKKPLVISTNRENPNAAETQTTRVEINGPGPVSGILSGASVSNPNSSQEPVSMNVKTTVQQTQTRTNNSHGQSNINRSRVVVPNPNQHLPNAAVANTTSSKVDPEKNFSEESEELAESVGSEHRSGHGGNGNYRKYRRGDGYNKRRNK